MKLFCACNSELIIDYPKHVKRNITGTNTHKGFSFGYCSKCEYRKWHDADYENMMFDLKNMNRQ